MELYSFIHGNSPYSFLSPPPLPYLYSPPQSYVHWTQTPDSHIYTANLPGVRKEEIRVEVEDGRYLVIRTELLLEEEEDELRGEEQRLRSFERKFRLPERVEVDRISAGYEDGVLTVRVPRRQRVPDVVVDLGVVEDARVARAA